MNPSPSIPARPRTASRTRLFAPALLLALAVPLTACGGDGGGGDGGQGPEPTLTSIEVSPSSETLTQVGATQQFSATARDQDGNAMSGVSFDWSSTNTAVATVDGDGLATAEGEGQTEIEAASSGVTGSATLTVTLEQQEPAAIARISGDGQNGKTTRQFSDPLVVEVTDDGGDPVAGATVDWSVEGGAVQLSSASTTTDGNGRAEITVTSDTLLVAHQVRATLQSSTAGDPTVDFDLETTVAWIRMGDDFFEDWQNRRNTNFGISGVSVGDTLEFVYADGASQHTVRSGEGQGGDDGDGVPAGSGMSMSSGTLAPGDSFRFVPDTEGEWTVFCEVHPTIMYEAVIDVQP